MYMWNESISVRIHSNTCLENRQGSKLKFVSIQQSHRLVPQCCQVILLQTNQAAQRTNWVPSSLPPGSPLQSQAFSWWTSCFLSTLRLELPLKVCQQFSIPEARRSADSSRINTVFFVHSGQSWRCQAPRGDLEEGHMNGDTPQCYLCALSRVDSGTHNSPLQTNFP